MRNLFLSLLTLICLPVFSQDILTGADQMFLYHPSTKGQAIALVANHTSMVGTTHLVDTLLSKGSNIVKIFSPEHGFRGEADAGESVNKSVDSRTGIPIISLYGNHKKPTATDMKGVDIVIYDLQDVGARFYTYHSTLHYVMEACAQNGVPLMILDRPNPNGYFVDGPILTNSYKSFVGMHPVPVVHGMTTGEYAQMINGEGWLAGGITCSLGIVPCKGYSHSMPYAVTVPPSPNLKTPLAVWMYPSTCFFEGTNFSLGRGTDSPFLMYGHPNFPQTDFSFTPISMPGAKTPPLMDKECNGVDLRNTTPSQIWEKQRIDLSYIIDAYKRFPNKDKFFTSYFNQLAGTSRLMTQIKQGMSEDEIRKSWKKGIDDFMVIRAKYLIYD